MQPDYRRQNIVDKVISKIIRETKERFDNDDIKQEILVAFMSNNVKEKFEVDLPSVLAFAKKIGAQAVYTHKRDMSGALQIPRRVIKEHRDRDEQLVTESVDFAIVNEVEVGDALERDDRTLFRLPIQDSFFALPRRDQYIERDINEGESIAQVAFSSGCERRALQARIVNLSKNDEEYCDAVQSEIENAEGITALQLNCSFS